MLQGLGQLLGGEGAEDPDLHQARLHPLLPQLVHRHLGGAGGGADEHQGHLRILHAVGLEEAVLPAGEGLKPGRHLQDAGLGGLHGLGLLDLVLHVMAAQVVGPHGQGVLRLEEVVFRVVLPHEGFHRVGVQQDDVLQGVAGDEPVLAHHHRQADRGVLPDGHGLEEVVIGLLVVLGVKLDPPGVPDAHGV